MMYRIYRHNKTGNQYRLLHVTNLHADVAKRDKFPITAVYQSIADLKIWSRLLEDFNQKFTPDH